MQKFRPDIIAEKSLGQLSCLHSYSGNFKKKVSTSNKLKYLFVCIALLSLDYIEKYITCGAIKFEKNSLNDKVITLSGHKKPFSIYN